jgi:hypothetical protein
MAQIEQKQRKKPCLNSQEWAEILRRRAALFMYRGPYDLVFPEVPDIYGRNLLQLVE